MTKVDGGASPYSRYLYGHQADVRRPSRTLPHNSCDVQVHIYSGDVDYPLNPGRLYDPPEGATFEAAQRVHRSLGIERGVLVHTTVHGTDNRLLLECLAKDPEHYRGVALIGDETTDAELQQLHRAGVRGVRFQFKRSWGIGTNTTGKGVAADEFKRCVARVAPLGWCVKLRSSPVELLENERLFRELEGVNVVIDHLGHLDMPQGLGQPAAQAMLDLLKKPNWWIQLSNGPKHSDPPYDDVVEIAQAFIAVAPDRAIWATDWPHPGYGKPVPNTTDLLELLFRYAPSEQQQQAILVDNPARLFGFDRADA